MLTFHRRFCTIPLVSYSPESPSCRAPLVRGSSYGSFEIDRFSVQELTHSVGLFMPGYRPKSPSQRWQTQSGRRITAGAGRTRTGRTSPTSAAVRAAAADVAAVADEASQQPFSFFFFFVFLSFVRSFVRSFFRGLLSRSFSVACAGLICAIISPRGCLRP